MLQWSTWPSLFWISIWLADVSFSLCLKISSDLSTPATHLTHLHSYLPWILPITLLMSSLHATTSPAFTNSFTSPLSVQSTKNQHFFDHHPEFSNTYGYSRGGILAQRCSWAFLPVVFIQTTILEYITRSRSSLWPSTYSCTCLFTLFGWNTFQIISSRVFGIIFGGFYISQPLTLFASL